MTVSDFHAAVGGTITALGVSMTMVGRSWGTTNPSKHRAPWRLPSLDDLIGRESAYTTPDFADVPIRGVLTQAWLPCTGPCGVDTPSLVHEDGAYTCGSCFTTTLAEAVS